MKIELGKQDIILGKALITFHNFLGYNILLYIKILSQNLLLFWIKTHDSYY